MRGQQEFGEPLLPTLLSNERCLSWAAGAGSPAHSSVCVLRGGGTLRAMQALLGGSGTVGWMPQLMHFNGRRDHSKSAQQIINIVFLSLKKKNFNVKN